MHLLQYDSTHKTKRQSNQGEKQLILDSRKYVNDARKLNKPGLQDRFDRHQRLRHDEIDKLFEHVKHKPFTTTQYRYLEYGIRYQGIWDIETSDFDPQQNFIICYDMLIRDIVTGKTEHVHDAITKKDIKLAVDEQNFDFDKRLLHHDIIQP